MNIKCNETKTNTIYKKINELYNLQKQKLHHNGHVNKELEMLEMKNPTSHFLKFNHCYKLWMKKLINQNIGLFNETAYITEKQQDKQVDAYVNRQVDR